MEWYLDTSVALHALLPGGDRRARDWIEQHYGTGGGISSSSLLQLEMVRTLRRERLDATLARPILDRVNLISIDDGVLAAAAAIQPHLRALDAIHLATCLLLGFGTTVVTHDDRMRRVAAELGLDAHDPLA